MACFEGFLSFAFGGANVFQCTAAISGSGDWRGALHILRVPYLSTTAFGGTRKSGSWTYLRNMADWWLTIDYSQDEGFWSFRDIIAVIYIICLHLSLYVNIWLPSKNSGNAPKDHRNHQSWHDLLLRQCCIMSCGRRWWVTTHHWIFIRRCKVCSLFVKNRGWGSAPIGLFEDIMNMTFWYILRFNLREPKWTDFLAAHFTAQCFSWEDLDEC